MASEHVLRLPRTDSPGDHVLLNTSSNGSNPLDIKLLATEGTEPYVKILKHSRISKYRAKNNHLSDPQWEALLCSILLQTHKTSAKQDPPEDDTIKDLELVASILDSKLTITIRKSISGIHQKLGELSLAKDPNAEINILDWANTAILRADSLQSEAEILQQKLVEQTQAVDKLNQQLEELIQAKKEHEDLLLLRCAVLLNEKKAKIRDQQRLMNVTKGPDLNELKKVQKARQTDDPKKGNPSASQRGKRKASSDEDDGFENHDVKVEERYDSDDVTPQHSDLDETDDEVDDADPVPAPPTTKGNVTEMVEANGSSNMHSGIGEGEDEDVEMPPPRELPFMKTGDERADKTEDHDAKMADDDESDDEL